MVLFTTSESLKSVLERPIADLFFALSLLIVLFAVAKRLKN